MAALIVRMEQTNITVVCNCSFASLKSDHSLLFITPYSKTFKDEDTFDILFVMKIY